MMEEELLTKVGRLQLEPQGVAPLQAARSAAGLANVAEADSLLLALPDPCLMAVLQCLAADGDQRSLFSAARAHSRLYQAAVAALSSITVGGIQQQQQRLDGVVSYLGKHAQHVSSVVLRGWAEDPTWPPPTPTARLRGLPPQLQLHSLELHGLLLQLQPGAGFAGVLGPPTAGAPLTQLRLGHCMLVDNDEGLAAALEQLAPGLQHLSLDVLTGSSEVQDADAEGGTTFTATGGVSVPASALQRMQQLTHLTLSGVSVQGGSGPASSLSFLQHLSALADLRLAVDAGACTIRASMLSGMGGTLTRLDTYGHRVEPGVLAGKPRLRHLNLNRTTNWEGGNAEGAVLLAQLQTPTLLTHLSLYDVTGSHREPEVPPAAAYAALTASSELRHLGLNKCSVPVDVWQHLVPTGRVLPHLTSLDVSELSYHTPAGVLTIGDYSRLPRGNSAAPPEASRLLSCCPGLRRLDVRYLACTAELLEPLAAGVHGPQGLQTLLIDADGSDAGLKALGVVWQLTGLRELDLDVSRAGTEGLLMQTAQLKQLTRLRYFGQHKGEWTRLELHAQAPGDKPVWRQVLTRHLRHRSPAIVQQALRALAATD